MSSIGETLRGERRKRNLELDQVSRELKIPRRFLEAIEDERFEGLPAGVFVKNFVRQYANLLGLDGEAIAAEAQRAMAPQPLPGEPGGLGAAQPEIHLPRMETWESIGDRRRWSSTLPALALVVVVMLVCSGVYAFWQRVHHETTAQTAEPPAAAVHAPTAAPPTQPAPAPAAPGEQPGGTAPAPNESAAAQPPAAGNPAEPNSADRPAPENHPANPPAANPPAAAANSPTAASPANANAANPAAVTGPLHVELSAQEPVWVMARQNGKYLFSGTLDANQTRTIDASGTLTLRVGNAGGLNVTVNGKPVGSLGPKGQIREIQLTSGGVQIRAEPKPEPADGVPATPHQPKPSATGETPVAPQPKPSPAGETPAAPQPKPSPAVETPAAPQPKPSPPGGTTGTPPPGDPR